MSTLKDLTASDLKDEGWSVTPRLNSTPSSSETSEKQKRAEKVLSDGLEMLKDQAPITIHGKTDADTSRVSNGAIAVDVGLVVQFHLDKIDEILIGSTRSRNRAWRDSVMTGIQAMERGIYAKFFPKQAAASVLANAATARQSEAEPNNRWYISCLMESLATLRLISLKDTNYRSVYDQAKQIILKELR